MLEEGGPLLGVGVLAPHPVAFSESANIIPHTMKTEPYTITNRGLQIHLRILKHNLPKISHTHFAILQCGYKNNLGTAIAIPLTQLSASETSESKDEFCRAADQNFIEIKYSQAASLGNQKVYLLGAGPLLSSKVSHPFYRCWLREYGQGEYGQALGVRFHKARYREYPIKRWDTDGASHIWNYENKSMTWAKDWSGARAALYFSKTDGPAFVVVLTFIHLLNEGGHTEMDVHIKPVQDCMKGPIRTVLNQVVLDRILVEDIPFGHGRGMAEAKTTFPFEDRVMTVRVKKEVIFDEDMFVLDHFFSGVKRGNSEMAAGV